MRMVVLQRASSFLVLMLASGCAASSDQAHPQTTAVGKRELLRRMEVEMYDLVRAATPRCEAVRQAALDQLNRLVPPSRLQVVDEVLARYGQKDEEQFIARIDAIVNDGVKQLDEILKELEREVQKKAYKVAGNDLPTETEFSTGYVEIDDIARSTIDQARRIADREGLRDLGYFRRGEVVRFTRAQRVDAPKLGRLSLFLSPPIPGRVVSGQESVGVLAAVQRKAIGPDVPLRLLQAVRHQILRGGVPIRDLGWRLDPNTPDHDGVVPLDDQVKDPSYLISRVGFPALRSENPEFASFRDYTFLASFELVVQRTDTSELLAGCAYELRWHVTFNGQVILLEGHNARPRVDHFAVLDHLLKGTAPPATEIPAAESKEPESKPSEAAPPAEPAKQEHEQPAAPAKDERSAPATEPEAPPVDHAPDAAAANAPPPVPAEPGGYKTDAEALEQPAATGAQKAEPPATKLEMEVAPSAAKDENALAMTWTISPSLLKDLRERGEALLDRYSDSIYTPSVKATRLGLALPKPDRSAAEQKAAMPPADEKLFQELGIKIGDVLVSINKVPIASKSFLLTALKELAKAEQLDVVLVRDGEERVLRYQLPKE